MEERWLALILHNGRVHCVDATCYHMGGPLLTSDIEDFMGVDVSSLYYCASTDFLPPQCMVCPWHRYTISLETGERLYQAI